MPTRADWPRRLGGYLIDAAVLTTVFLAVRVDRSGWVTGAIAFAYAMIAVAVRGRTVGQAAMHVRVTLMDGTSRPTLVVAAIRAFVPLIGSILVAITDPVGGVTLRLAAVIAAVWGLIVYAPVSGRESLGLHDRASGTQVLVDKPRR